MKKIADLDDISSNVSDTETKNVTAIVIGDIHFRPQYVKEGECFIEKCINACKEKEPTFIVIMGDTLHTHETVKIQAHKLAINLFKELKKIAPLIVLIGNHDLSIKCSIVPIIIFLHL